MGLKPVEFWNLTLSEFDRMARGYHRRQVDGWRRTRLLVTTQLNIHREHGTPAYRPEEVFTLPGDQPIELETLQPDEVEDMWAEMDELDADIL